MAKDKIEDHYWIPEFIFQFTSHNRRVMIILYCSHCNKYRYQYGDKLK